MQKGWGTLSYIPFRILKSDFHELYMYIIASMAQFKGIYKIKITFFERRNYDYLLEQHNVVNELFSGEKLREISIERHKVIVVSYKFVLHRYCDAVW